MCLFVLISGPLGWAALIFLLLAVLVLVLVNMKLTQVVRCVGACVSCVWCPPWGQGLIVHHRSAGPVPTVVRC